MRFQHLIFAVAALTHGVIAADPNCDRGVKSRDGKFCCPRKCGTCGGINCHKRNGGSKACCTSGIAISGKKCNAQNAPCAIIKKATPKPAKPPIKPPVQQPAKPGVKRPTNIGMHAGGNMSIFERNQKYNTDVDNLIMYQTVKYMSWDWISTNLDAGIQVTIIIEFADSYPNLWDIAGGKYDAELIKFAQKAKEDGRFFKTRLLHEYNGNWYSWGVYNGGSNSVAGFKAAFRHVVNLLKSFGLNTMYQLSYNCLTVPVTSTDDMMDLYPGDDVVDEVCVSSYNFQGTDVWHADIRSIDTIISPWYEAMAFNDKYLCIAEMSSTDSQGKKSEWIRETWRSLALRFPRIRSINWFFENKGNHDLDLNSDAQIRAFREGLQEFDALTGNSRSGAVQSADVLTSYSTGSVSEVSSGTSYEHADPDYSELQIEAVLAGERYEMELKLRGLEIPHRHKNY